MLIGISGRAGAGKDEVGKILVEDYHCRRHAFATKMKAAALALDPIIDFDVDGHPLRLSDLIEEVGPEEAKKHPEVRRLYQRMGTEVGRRTLDEDIWIKLLFQVARHKNVVITDVRFVNELQAIQKRNGFVFRVIRPDLDELSGEEAKHISEHQLSDECGLFDGFIINDATIGDLKAKVAEALASIGER
jgi:hypothetical protein